ncbi:ammonium transporter AmtA [Salpingoeca rosetta]|uniref:Ammonium transporter n=1 Tax=Salpingoeca rosetta (strain ATCC 50818 / BSB-021) TaxID=946362 RepID=F2TWY1_SALR5|nr:ammonium transporter AmtA [Salpingoeca rosetta]EGD75890.1 ammonium transporter AmtA [Salpingoeca rosetta]|eukprot:XP_004998066.1 ammonium transporter AmtA [Salpingoeca rosetta]
MNTTSTLATTTTFTTTSTSTTVPTDPCIDAGDTAWVLTATLLILGMIPGLALFEAGLLRSKNTVSVLTQVLCGCSIMGVMWYLFGFSFVFGESLGGFIGSPASYPALVSVPDNGCFPGMRIPGLAYATFQMMFASITPLLMTGAFAERLLFAPYVLFIVAWEIIVYYPVAHWIWGSGWLTQYGVLDYAGGIVIHTSAGASALVSAILVHPRIGFMGAHGHFKPSNLPIACVGGFCLWMGWFGFNAGSSLTSGYITATVLANTQIASTSCACVWLLLSWYRGRPNVEEILNGAIAGLAGVTPAAGFISTGSAMVLGLTLGFASFFSIDIIKYRFHIDDALDVSSVHGVPGVVGALAIGIAAHPAANPLVAQRGIIYGGSGKLLFYQAAAIVIVAVWGAVWTYVILKTIHYFMPLSTHHMSDKDDRDRIGLDELEHDCAAYGVHSHHWVPVDDGDDDYDDYDDYDEEEPLFVQGSGNVAVNAADAFNASHRLQDDVRREQQQTGGGDNLEESRGGERSYEYWRRLRGPWQDSMRSTLLTSDDDATTTTTTTAAAAGLSINTPTSAHAPVRTYGTATTGPAPSAPARGAASARASGSPRRPPRRTRSRRAPARTRLKRSLTIAAVPDGGSAQ